MYMCVHVCVRARARERERARVCVCVCVCIHGCMYTCTYVHESEHCISGRSSSNSSGAAKSFCRRNNSLAMIELTRGRPRQRDGLPRTARIMCGGRLPCCRATAVRHAPKMRLGVRFGVSSPHRAPDRPAPLRPVRGRRARMQAGAGD